MPHTNYFGALKISLFGPLTKSLGIISYHKCVHCIDAFSEMAKKKNFWNLRVVFESVKRSMIFIFMLVKITIHNLLYL